MSIPMKPAKVFTEQINARITPDMKEKLWYLKGQGVDVQTLFRTVLEQIVDEAMLEVQKGETLQSSHP
jgi:antitoxin component of RelBE/YafQ-DinJ toxin-antitoxin module